MRKPLLWIGLVTITLIVAAFAYIATRPNAMQQQVQAQSPAPSTSASDTPTTTDLPETTTPGTYIDYSRSTFEQTQGRRVLFFHAAWCPQCRALDKSITAGVIPSGVTILKVDYDTAASLRQQYGVTLQTTLVEIDAQGNLVKKYVAYYEPTLAAVVKGLGL